MSTFNGQDPKSRSWASVHHIHLPFVFILRLICGEFELNISKLGEVTEIAELRSQLPGQRQTGDT